MTTPDNRSNCPFYGHYLLPTGTFDRPFLLIELHSNRCALILDAHSPCIEEIVGRPIDWRTCSSLKRLMP